jgi:hypothetical protein
MFILLLKFILWIAIGLLVLFVSGYIAWKHKHKIYREDKGVEVELWSDDEQKNP